MAAGAVLHDYAGHHDVVHGLVWISENVLASYSADGNVRVWNVAHPASITTSPPQPEFASYSVPLPWKVVHIGRGNRSSLVCVAASD